jgi:hypothetical protein
VWAVRAPDDSAEIVCHAEPSVACSRQRPPEVARSACGVRRPSKDFYLSSNATPAAMPVAMRLPAVPSQIDLTDANAVLSFP